MQGIKTMVAMFNLFKHSSILLTYFENQWMYLIDDTDSKLWQGHQNRKLYTTIMNMPWYKNRTRSERLYLHANMVQKISLGRNTVAFLQPSFFYYYISVSRKYNKSTLCIINHEITETPSFIKQHKIKNKYVILLAHTYRLHDKKCWLCKYYVDGIGQYYMSIFHTLILTIILRPKYINQTFGTHSFP